MLWIGVTVRHAARCYISARSAENGFAKLTRIKRYVGQDAGKENQGGKERMSR